MAKNEFDDLDSEELAPKAEEADVIAHPGANKMIASGQAGVIYDWTSAPEGVKAPPRKDLGGQTVTIKKADIVLPSADRPWEKTKAGDKEFKYCTFTLYYDVDGQQENYSGVRVFNREGMYSHPTVTRDRKNQASRLLGLYADFRKKDINEVSLREFMGFLNSQPKAKIIKMAVANPETGAIIEKNAVNEFI
jgi:hypothetical protein